MSRRGNRSQSAVLADAAGGGEADASERGWRAATPTWALAATRFSSASRRSGRRSSRLEGRPAGGTGGEDRLGHAPQFAVGVAQHGIGIAAEQHAQLVLRLPDLALQVGNVGLGNGQLRLRGRHVQPRHGAALVLRLGQLDELAARLHRASRDGELLVERLQREVSGRDARYQACGDVIARVLRGQQLRARSLGHAAVLAPEVDLVGEVALQLEDVADRRRPRRDSSDREARGRAAPRRSPRACGSCCRRVAPSTRARLLDARGGDAHVEVIGECLAQQLHRGLGPGRSPTSPGRRRSPPPGGYRNGTRPGRSFGADGSRARRRTPQRAAPPRAPSASRHARRAHGGGCGTRRGSAAQPLGERCIST